MRQLLPLTLLLLPCLATIGQKDCRSTVYRQEAMLHTPGLAIKVQEIEGFTRNFLHRSPVTITGGQTLNDKTQAIVSIPVVVHIVYNSGAQNISDAQVQSQIDILNADYVKKNADTIAIPPYFSALSADCGFHFALANLDANGAPTSGIIRKHTNVPSFGLDDHIKFSASGGDDAWDRDRYLNIWVGNLTAGMMGYSSVPGGPRETDGIVVLYTAFGSKGAALAPFNLGRTATHEIGHWLNMIHVWGDTDCGDDDVEDTPQQRAANSGNPSGIRITCSNGPYGDMYMNFMDFTDDIGMHMFTYGQRDRMRSLFADGGCRHAILSSNGLSGNPLTTANPPATLAGGGDSANCFHFYPNPAVNTVSITMTDASSVGSVLELYSQTGQKLISMRVTQLSFPLDVSILPRGIYFVKLNNGRKQSGMKLMKI